MGLRLPDFLIIGAMKAGTTSLFRWLGSHSRCSLPTVKEPGFFCDDHAGQYGIRRYSDLFAGIPAGLITGEASHLYTAPRFAERAASRIRETLPEVKLVFLAREPVSRLRSQYRHEVQRGRENRPLAEAVEASGQYIGKSLYFRCLMPYLDRFPRRQICVVTSEELLVPPYLGWSEVLTHLEVPYEDPLGITFNVSGEKAQFSRAMHWLWRRGAIPKSSRLPGSMRRVGKKILLRENATYDALMKSSHGPLPATVIETLEEDSLKLERWLGRELWKEPMRSIGEPLMGNTELLDAALGE